MDDHESPRKKVGGSRQTISITESRFGLGWINRKSRRSSRPALAASTIRRHTPTIGRANNAVRARNKCRHGIDGRRPRSGGRGRSD
jgi:hypothetical protein